MKKQTNEQQTKYFRFQFTKATIVLSIAAIILCVAAVTISVIRLLHKGVHSFYDFLSSPLLILIGVFGIAVVVALLIKSQYIVDDKNFVTQFGFIKSKVSLKDITAVVYDTETKKMTVYMGENFSVISVSETWNEEFVRALLKGNPDIDYSFTVTENKPQDGGTDKGEKKDKNKPKKKKK
jgi:hypothetical protein